MSTQRYAVEFGHQVVGIAFRVPGGFMFISSDPRFDRLDGETFPRARALARRLGELCDADRLSVRADHGKAFDAHDLEVRQSRWPSGRPVRRLGAGS